MARGKKGVDGTTGGIDGDVGRGIRIPNGSRGPLENDEPELAPDLAEVELEEEEDVDPAERRRDPLRKP